MKMIPLDGRLTNVCSVCKEEKDIKHFAIVGGRSFREHKCGPCRSKKYSAKTNRVAYVSKKDRGVD